MYLYTRVRERERGMGRIGGRDDCDTVHSAIFGVSGGDWVVCRATYGKLEGMVMTKKKAMIGFATTVEGLLWSSSWDKIKRMQLATGMQLHVETPNGVVTITTGLEDRVGRATDNVNIRPNTEIATAQFVRSRPYNMRLIRLKQR